jgi:predicted dehydrogenase
MLERDVKEPLRVGVVGVGSLGQWHARIYSSLASARLVGVYDLDASRAREIAARYGTRCFENLDDLASEVEAASIVVPADAHYDLAARLIGRGVHLLVEKPIASSTRDAEAMVAMAGAADVILQVGHVERFNPVLTFLEKTLDRPRFIEAVRLQTYPPPRGAVLPRGTEVSVVLDLMIHDLEIILHLVRRPVNEIRAVGVPVLSASEDIANARLAFEGGCVANVTASRISQERMRKIRVFQTDTYVSLDYQNQSGRLSRKGPARITSEEVPIEKGDPLANELASFVACVGSRHQPVVSGRHASDALRLAVRICEHIRAGNT